MDAVHDSIRAKEADAALSRIPSQVKACLLLFEDLHAVLLQPGTRNDDEIKAPALEDEAGRFRVWAGNIGAHRRGRSSLNYRLRDASHIRMRVEELLNDLAELIQDAISIVSGDKVPWDKLDNDADALSSDSESSDDELEDDTELRQLFTSMKKVITFLFRISMAIRNPAAHDQFLNSTDDVDTSYYEPFDTQHVQGKFPTADAELTKRVGKAISRRRMYFKYRESHTKKIAAGITLDDTKTENRAQSTVASSLPESIKGRGILDLGDDQASESGFTQTSFATSAHGDGDSQLKVPPLPKEAEGGKHFECPFCFMIISIRSRRTWKKHVFTDLSPYVCTFPDCTSSNKFFARRHEWSQHERQAHRRWWNCTLNGCSTHFSKKLEFEDHIRKVHKEVSSPNRLPSILKMSERRPEMDSTADCCFCGDSMSLLQLEKHVGKHQEQLALFALPSVDNVESDQDSGKTATDGSEDEVSVHASRPADLTNEAVQELDPQPPGDVGEEAKSSPEDLGECIKQNDGGAGDVVDLILQPEEGLQRGDLGLKTAQEQAREMYQQRLEKQEKEVEERKRIIADFERKKIEDAKKKMEEEEALIARLKKQEEEKKVREKAEWEEFERKRKEKDEDIAEAKRKKEEKLEAEMRRRLANFGFQENQIEAIINPEKAKDVPDALSQGKLPDHRESHDRPPTYCKVHRDHLAIETLEFYGLPWEWDRTDSDYIIILREMDPRETEILFEHTRRIRSEKVTSTRLVMKETGTKSEGVPEYAWVRRRRESESPIQIRASSSPKRTVVGIGDMFGERTDAGATNQEGSNEGEISEEVNKPPLERLDEAWDEAWDKD